MTERSLEALSGFLYLIALILAAMVVFVWMNDVRDDLDAIRQEIAPEAVEVEGKGGTP